MQEAHTQVDVIKVKLSNGMIVETRIIYDKVTYFNYIIEKLELMTKWY